MASIYESFSIQKVFNERATHLKAFLSPAKYLCGIHYFDNCKFRKGRLSLMQWAKRLFELNSQQ